MVGLVNLDVGSVTSGLFHLIDELFTSDDEREAAKLKVLELESKGLLAQIMVNTQEAKHENVFVSGWRPFVGWVCGSAFAYSFILQPFFAFITWAVFTFSGRELPLDTLPTLDLSTLIPVLCGMLGLGGLRSWEKRTGTNKNR